MHKHEIWEISESEGLRPGLPRPSRPPRKLPGALKLPSSAAQLGRHTKACGSVSVNSPCRARRPDPCRLRFLCRGIRCLRSSNQSWRKSRTPPRMGFLLPGLMFYLLDEVSGPFERRPVERGLGLVKSMGAPFGSWGGGEASCCTAYPGPSFLLLRSTSMTEETESIASFRRSGNAQVTLCLSRLTPANSLLSFPILQLTL